MRAVEWLLVAIAVGALAAGILFSGPICAFRSVELTGRCDYVFPIPVFAGLSIAALAVTIVAVRLRRRSS